MSNLPTPSPSLLLALCSLLTTGNSLPVSQDSVAAHEAGDVTDLYGVYGFRWMLFIIFFIICANIGFWCVVEAQSPSRAGEEEPLLGHRQ